MPEQWPRALLRAALREAGYDAVGTRTLTAAMRFPPQETGRGAVRLVIVDQAALGGPNDPQLGPLLERHGAPATMLLARAAGSAPPGGWQRVLRRPLSVADIVASVETLLPLEPDARHPLH